MPIMDKEQPDRKRVCRPSKRSLVLDCLLEKSLLCFCTVTDELRSLRLTCRMLKRLVDEELDRRIDDVLNGTSAGDELLEYEDEISNSLASVWDVSVWIHVGWPKAYTTKKKLAAYIVSNLDPSDFGYYHCPIDRMSFAKQRQDDSRLVVTK